MTQKDFKDWSLEDIIHMANQLGLEYVEKRREAERAELLRTSIRSQIMIRLEENKDEKFSEAKLKRLAEADVEYCAFLESIATLRSDAEKARIRYESYRDLFDARKTMLYYKQVELKTL